MQGLVKLKIYQARNNRYIEKQAEVFMMSPFLLKRGYRFR
jgi:hypothetical protein